MKGWGKKKLGNGRKGTAVVVWMPVGLHRALKRAAAEQERSMTEIIRSLLSKVLGEEVEKEKRRMQAEEANDYGGQWGLDEGEEDYGADMEKDDLLAKKLLERTVQFRMSTAEYKRLKRVALEADRTVSYMVNRMVMRCLEMLEKGSGGRKRQGNPAAVIPVEDQACARVRASVRCPDTPGFRKWCVKMEQKGLYHGEYDYGWYYRTGRNGEWDLAV